MGSVYAPGGASQTPILLLRATAATRSLLAAAGGQAALDGPVGAGAAHVVVVDATSLSTGEAVAAVTATRTEHADAGVLVVAASTEPGLVRGLLDAGATSLLPSDATPEQVRATLEGVRAGAPLVDLRMVRPTLDTYAQLLAVSRHRDRAVIESLAAAVQAKDAVTGRHLHEVSRLACQLAAEVSPELAEREDFLFGCLVHDVGKIGVPEAILTKPAALDEAEWAVMRRHPLTGADVVRPLGLSPMVEQIVLRHHERWDGTGYPRGLQAQDIPLEARIFSVCDALEAMTATRPYRAAMPVRAALAEVHACSGRQFDPFVVSALGRGLDRGRIAVTAPPGTVSARRREPSGVVGCEPA
jgi:putative two-component system response regulator